VVAMALPLEVALSADRFRGAMVDIERVFFRKVVGGEILSVRTQLLMKVPKCDGDFLKRLIKRSISHHGE